MSKSRIGSVVGGIITFRGVALYSGGQVIGGLGVSGDTSYDDRAIAYRMRAQAELNATHTNGNISYHTGSGAEGLVTSPD